MSKSFCRLQQPNRSRRYPILVSVVVGCAGEPPAERTVPQPISEQEEIIVPPTKAETTARVTQAWSEATHVSVSALAAEKWQLSTTRIDTIGDAADEPDAYEGGIDGAFNQQWSHAYLYSAYGLWMWGDAHENFDDCMTGRLALQLEGPECKDGKSASYHYASGDQRLGDTYLGYAIHYIEDVSLVLHSSDPTPAPDLALYHARFENWVRSNWTSGHVFRATVAADNYYYPVGDPQQSVRNAAWASSYWNLSGDGRRAWIAYRDSGYPSGEGTGNAELVTSTRRMLIRASRYATGAIHFALSAFEQWTSRY